MSEKNKAVVRRIVEDLFNTGDTDIADEAFSEEYLDHTPSNPALSGRENVKRWIVNWREAFPDTRNTVENLVAEDDEVAVRWITRATHKGEFMGVSPTGRQVEIAGFAIFRVAGGKVVEGWDTYDVWSTLRQLRAGSSPEDILEFWFGREGDPGYGEAREAWFRKDSGFDQEIRDRFGDLYEEAAAGGLESWKDKARSCLARVILLDQFPRNMFRGDPRSYATDKEALRTSKHTVERAFDRELSPLERGFVYMPFMHSENLEDQRRCVELFRAMGEAGENTLKYAISHMNIVERFRRFPHRNEVLGRESTPEEAAFLKQPGSSF